MKVFCSEGTGILHMKAQFPKIFELKVTVSLRNGDTLQGEAVRLELERCGKMTRLDM